MMIILGDRSIPEWVWWTKGECVVKVLKTGHFPETVMAQLPSDKITEIDIGELELNVDRN